MAELIENSKGFAAYVNGETHKVGATIMGRLLLCKTHLLGFIGTSIMIIIAASKLL